MLTKEEVEELPEGAEILVKWSGVVNPVEYVVHRKPDGSMVCVNKRGNVHKLRLVGTELFHTHVWRLR